MSTAGETIKGSCHCGAVQIALDIAPTDINDCQCSHCQKRGVLWSYYSKSSARVTGPTSTYSWGDKGILFHFCSTCGCTTHWSPVDPERDRMGINVRLLEPADRAGAHIRQSPGPR